MTARALQIHWLPSHPTRIFAVYPPGADEDGLQAIVSELDTLPFVSVRLTHGRWDKADAPSAPVIAMLFEEGGGESHARANTTKLKELTNPELAITVAQLKVAVLECIVCGYPSVSVEGDFLPGLEAEDTNRIWERLVAKMRKLPDLRSTIQKPSPYTELNGLLTRLLKELGVHVCAIYVANTPDTRPCIHQS